MSDLLSYFSFEFFNLVLNSFSTFLVGLIALCFLLNFITEVIKLGRGHTYYD